MLIDVEVVAFVTATTPAADTVVPVVEPNVDIPVTSNVPPIFAFSVIPTPPTTVNAPVLIDVEVVALLIATTPAADTVAPVVEPNVDIPVTVKLSATITSDVVCPIVIGTPLVAVPTLIAVPLISMVEPSNVNAPELISTAPVVVISTMAALPIILTPARPSRVKAPAVVLKLEAAPASKLIPPVPAFKSKAVVNVSLPIVMVLPDAPVPIFIACASVSLPILIAPADEFIERAPAESISNPVVPSCLIVAVSPAPNVIAAESLINLISLPTVTSVATAKLWFIEISPSALILIRSTPPVIVLSVVSV